MANTLTISISDKQKAYLKEYHVKKSDLFQGAIKLHMLKDSFSRVIKGIGEYHDFVIHLLENIQNLQREIERRNERIASLQDVLAKKEMEQS